MVAAVAVRPTTRIIDDATTTTTTPGTDYVEVDVNVDWDRDWVDDDPPRRRRRIITSGSDATMTTATTLSRPPTIPTIKTMATVTTGSVVGSAVGTVGTLDRRADEASATTTKVPTHSLIHSLTRLTRFSLSIVSSHH